MPVQVCGRHRGGPGLEVHHDGPAVGVALQPVHPSGDLHGADLRPQLLLDRDEFPRVLPVPGEELVHHDPGPLPLLLAVPGAAEVQVMPDLVDPLADHGRVGASGGEHGGRVDEDPEVPDHVRGPGARGDLEQPAQPAPVERLDLGRRQPDQQAVRRGGDRPGIGQLGELVPLPRVGATDPGSGEPGELGGGGLAQCGRVVRVGRGPAQVGGQRGQRKPPRRAPGNVLDLDLVTGKLGQEPGRPFLAVVAA